MKTPLIIGAVAHVSVSSTMTKLMSANTSSNLHSRLSAPRRLHFVEVYRYLSILSI